MLYVLCGKFLISFWNFVYDFLLKDGAVKLAICPVVKLVFMANNLPKGYLRRLREAHRGLRENIWFTYWSYVKQIQIRHGDYWVCSSRERSRQMQQKAGFQISEKKLMQKNCNYRSTKRQNIF